MFSPGELAAAFLIGFVAGQVSQIWIRWLVHTLLNQGDSDE